MRQQQNTYRRHFSYFLRNVALAFLVATLGACSLFSSKVENEEQGTELKAAVDKPEGELFERAQSSYASGLYTVAAETYQSLRDGYPLGPYAEYAELKVADCRFETSEYDIAAGLYADFYKNHPASASAPYALLRAGRAYALANRGIGRDPASLQLSLENFALLQQKFPTSPYAGAAREFEEESRQKLEAHQKQVIDYYRRNAKQQAADAREKTFKEQWGKSSEEIIYSSLPKAEASATKTAKEPAEASSPEPKTAIADAAEELTVVGQEPVPFANPKEELSQDSSGGDSNGIRLVECDPEKKIASIYLTKAIADVSFEVPGALENDGRNLVVKLPSLRLPEGKNELKLGCFGEEDLEISATGRIKLKNALLAPPESKARAGERAATPGLVSLDNPPRLLIVLRQ